MIELFYALLALIYIGLGLSFYRYVIGLGKGMYVYNHEWKTMVLVSSVIGWPLVCIFAVFLNAIDLLKVVMKRGGRK